MDALRLSIEGGIQLATGPSDNLSDSHGESGMVCCRVTKSLAGRKSALNSVFFSSVTSPPRQRTPLSLSSSTPVSLKSLVD